MNLISVINELNGLCDYLCRGLMMDNDVLFAEAAFDIHHFSIVEEAFVIL
jgi:hypothetical protein